MSLEKFVYFTLWARSNAGPAAHAFLSSADEATVMLLLDAVEWKDEHVRDFERRKLAVMIESTKFKRRFWFASPLCVRALVPPVPRITPGGLVALARGVSDALLAGWQGQKRVA